MWKSRSEVGGCSTWNDMSEEDDVRRFWGDVVIELGCFCGLAMIGIYCYEKDYCSD